MVTKRPGSLTKRKPGYANDTEVKAIIEAYEREIVYPAAKKGILLSESWDVIDPPSKPRGRY